MSWADTLRHAETRLNKKGDIIGAFLGAFGALEICYRAVATKNGWRPATREERGFRASAEWLRDKELISSSDCEVAIHVGSARNVVAHALGFEPSHGQAQRTITEVRRLCSRFSQSVADAMTRAVVVASPDQPVGELLAQIVEDGISQFPVVEGKTVVGTLTDGDVLRALDREDGLLDPQTPVRELMHSESLPSIDPNATLEAAWRVLENTKSHALLVLQDGLPTGILTKYDLLRRLEL